MHTQNKNLQALLLVPRVFVPCKVCESCKEDRSRFCLNSHGGNEQFCLSVLRNFPGCGLGAGLHVPSCTAVVQVVTLQVPVVILTWQSLLSAGAVSFPFFLLVFGH